VAVQFGSGSQASERAVNVIRSASNAVKPGEDEGGAASRAADLLLRMASKGLLKKEATTVTT
jgi:hypothetical protein